LGTAILPPDALAQLVADNDDNDDDGDEDVVQDLRSRISLLQVTAVPQTTTTPSSSNINDKEEDTTTVPSTSTSTPERDQAIQEALPKVYKAVQSLPDLVLKEATSEQVSNAMQRFANEQGVVDRQAFSEILGTLRAPTTTASSSNSIKFELMANVIRGDSITQVQVETTNVMMALGLAMRYRVTVQVSDDCCDYFEEGEGGVDATLMERFPAFRPMRELYEDAKIMDGFIPGMFGKAKNLDNEMKQ
jgi:hypothetical protein